MHASVVTLGSTKFKLKNKIEHILKFKFIDCHFQQLQQTMVPIDGFKLLFKIKANDFIFIFDWTK